MKRARTPSAAIPRKKVKRTKSFKMIPSKSLVFQANTVGAGPELKNIDSNLVGVSGVATPIGLPDWSPTITLLNGVAQGATEVTRVGRKITMTKITVNWNVAMPSAAVGEVPLGLRLSMISRPMGLRHQFSGFLQWIISTPIITSPMLIVL